MGNFFGTGNLHKKNFRSFKEAKKYALSLNLKSVKEWQKTRHPEDIPSNPSISYKNDGWINWADFINTKKLYNANWKTYNEAKEFVAKNNIKTRKSYSRIRKRYYLDFPGRPELIYANKGWVSWAEFLGNDELLSTGRRNFRSLKEHQKFFKTIGIKNRKDFWKYLKKNINTYPKDLARSPKALDKSIGWTEFLGTTNINNKFKVFIKYKDAKSILFKKKINSRNKYKIFIKNNPNSNFPSEISTFRKDKDFISFADLFSKA